MQGRDISTQEALKNITLKIKIRHKKITSIRIWIGVKLIWLSSLFFGCDIDVDREENH